MSKIILFRIILFIVIIFLTACSNVEDRKAKYFARGMALYEQGNFTKARLEFKNVLQIDPKDAQSYYMFATIEEKEQNWRKAYALLLRTIELDPNHFDALVHLGRLYALSGASDKALDVAEKALALKPGDAAALVLKSLAQMKSGDKDAAIAIAETAVKTDPANIDGLSLLATLYADQHHMKKAIALIENGLKVNPDSTILYLLLAKFYDETNNIDKTIEQLKKVIDLKPDDLQHRNRLAGYFHSKKMFEQAEQVLNDTIKIFPDDMNAKLALAQYLRQRGEKDKSETVLKSFIAQSPNAFDLQLGLADLLLDTNRNEDALSVLDVVVDKAGDSKAARKAHVKKASVFIQSSDFDHASNEVAVVLDEDPKDVDALLIRAGISLATNDVDRGIADLRTLLKEQPGHVRALRLKARAHLKKQEIELAKQSLEKAIEVEPQEAQANIELVQLLIYSGELDAAVTVLEKMRRFVPDDLAILQAMAKIRLKQKNFTAIAELAAVMIKTDPEQALGHYYQGMALQAQKQLLLSSEAFEKSLQRNPDATEPLIGLAQNKLATGDSEGALARVQKVIDANPEHFLAHNLKGEIYLSQKQFEQAITSFNQAIQINPAFVTAYRNLVKIDLYNKKVDAALEHLKSGYDHSKNVSLGLEYAQLLMQKGAIDKAQVIYDELFEKQPNLLAIRNNYAMLLINHNPDPKALDKALTLAAPLVLSNNPIYLDTLGWGQFKNNDFTQAIKTLERAVALLKSQNQVNAEINYHLAEAYAVMERKPEAVSLLKVVVASPKPFIGIERARELLQELQL